jgi:hypothetical protein
LMAGRRWLQNTLISRLTSQPDQLPSTCRRSRAIIPTNIRDGTTAGAERVYAEKVSGVVTERKQLTKAIAALQEGDTLLVCRPQHQGPPECLGDHI